MKTTYDKSIVGPLSITQARTLCSFHGVGCELVVKTFACQGATGLRLEVRPAPEAARHVLGVSHDGFLRFTESDDRGKRIVEQRVTVRGIVTEVHPFTDFRGAAEAEAREVCQRFFVRFEAISEYLRRQIAGAFAPAYRDRGAAALETRYGSATRQTTQLLSTLNWPLLLADTLAPETFRNVVDFTMAHNHPRCFALHEPNAEAIELASNDYRDFSGDAHALRGRMDAAARAAQRAMADEKATALLRNVCGEDHHRHFLAHRCINVGKDGWTFRLRPGAFVECTDPHGRRASLCIHTVSLSCNPIDEIVLAYLHLRHKLDEYLATAIVHGSDPGFTLAPFRQRVKAARAG